MRYYEIEDNIPAPRVSPGRKIRGGPPRNPKGAPPKYPFKDMKVGQSFLVAGDSAVSARASASSHGKRYGTDFASRGEGEGIRIWRIE